MSTDEHPRISDKLAASVLARWRRSCVAMATPHPIACAVLALLLFLSLFATGAVAQPNFDIGDSELAVRCSAVAGGNLSISPVNLIFDNDLALTHRYSEFVNLDIYATFAYGYEASWSYDQASGDINYVVDTLGCAEYEFSFSPNFAFRIDLTDAHWGAGSNTSVYKFLIDYLGTGTVNLYVRSPGAQGTWSSAIQVSNNDRFTYWDLIRATHDANYTRERTSFGGKTFHVTGFDNLLPLPSTMVTSARLDVNLSVHSDIGVPSGSSLLIEGYYESPAISAYTTLYFDAGAVFTVEGTLSTMEQRFANEWVVFTSSAATPASGDWEGVYGSAADLINLNLTFIQYATTGLHTVDCQAVETSSLRILYCDGDGLYSESSSSLHRNLYSNFNGENGARIRTGSTAEFHESSFIGSLAANGIAVLDDAMARVRTSQIYNNYGHGVIGAAAGRIILDSCAVYNNGINGADGWAGVYGLYNDLWITVRHSQIHDQYTGIGMNWAIANGYESSTSPVTWDNPDSLARNCIYNNGFNLFGYYATFELAKPYYDGSVPHYQGGQSSIYYSPPDPTRYQGSFSYSQAEMERNFWYNNYTFWVQGGSLSTDDPLPADSAGCYFGEPFTGSSGGVINASTLTRYRQWESFTSDSLMRTLYAGRQTLESPDLSAGLGLLWRTTDASTVETFCANLIANSARPEVLLPSYRYVAAARMRDRDWSGAHTAFNAMAGQAARAAESSYTGARAMAALALYLDGDARSARASLDSLLTAFPDDLALRTVETLIGGRVAISTPKTAREMTATPTGISLHEAHPNPFDASSAVAFTLPEAMAAALTVHDINGRVVRRLADGMYPAGRTQLRFDSGDLPAGVYLLRLSAGEAMLTRRVLIIR